jgi:hypothetical protein
MRCQGLQEENRSCSAEVVVHSLEGFDGMRKKMSQRRKNTSRRRNAVGMIETVGRPQISAQSP